MRADLLVACRLLPLIAVRRSAIRWRYFLSPIGDAVSHRVQNDGHRIRGARVCFRCGSVTSFGRTPGTSGRAASLLGVRNDCHGAGARSRGSALHPGGLRLGLRGRVGPSASIAQPDQSLGDDRRCDSGHTAGDHVGAGHSSRANRKAGRSACACVAREAIQSVGRLASTFSSGFAAARSALASSRWP